MIDYDLLDMSLSSIKALLEDSIKHPIVSVYIFPHYNTICDFMKESKYNISKAKTIIDLFNFHVNEKINIFYTSEWMIMLK